MSEIIQVCPVSAGHQLHSVPYGSLDHDALGHSFKGTFSQFGFSVIGCSDDVVRN